MTETLLEWGIEPVGCTRFCEQPGLTPVGGTKDPDVSAIAELSPDLVIVDAEENRIEDHDALVAAGLEVRALHIRAVSDVIEQLEPLAVDLGLDWEMPALPALAEPTLSAFVPIWKRPWMALGAPTYGASLLERIGVANAYASDSDTYPETTVEQAAARHPDVVLAPSEPYPFGERHRADLERIAPTVFLDGKDLLWWGARTPGAIVRVSAMLGSPGVDPAPPGAGNRRPGLRSGHPHHGDRSD